MEGEKTYYKCLRCNRRLRTDKAKKLGYGPSCLRKAQQEAKILNPNLFSLENKNN